MQLIPIDVDETKNERFRNIPGCAEILDIYPGFYQRVGFHKPWIGYFATFDGASIVGCGGFKGEPKNGRIEIAYGTFPPHEGKGIGKEICRQLVQLTLQTDSSLLIAARTLSADNASAHILQHNGFTCTGIVYDDEDGDVWEWVYNKQE
jgi:RimJ/RimL family protein N-acetyltransferase